MLDIVSKVSIKYRYSKIDLLISKYRYVETSTFRSIEVAKYRTCVSAAFCPPSPGTSLSWRCRLFFVCVGNRTETFDTSKYPDFFVSTCGIERVLASIPRDLPDRWGLRSLAFITFMKVPFSVEYRSVELSTYRILMRYRACFDMHPRGIFIAKAQKGSRLHDLRQGAVCCSRCWMRVEVERIQRKQERFRSLSRSFRS